MLFGCILLIIFLVSQGRPVLFMVVIIDGWRRVVPFDELANNEYFIVYVWAHLIIVHLIPILDQVLNTLHLFLHLFWLSKHIDFWLDVSWLLLGLVLADVDENDQKQSVDPGLNQKDLKLQLCAVFTEGLHCGVSFHRC